MNSDHETLLFYTAVRWLSKGNVVSRFFELRTEIKLFLEMVKKDSFNNFFSDETWLQGLAYLADITEQLNKFNIPDTVQASLHGTILCTLHHTLGPYLYWSQYFHQLHIHSFWMHQQPFRISDRLL